MGFLYYGNDSYGIQIEDRDLAHLKVALLTLLRANQSVSFTFFRPTRAGGGRDTLWISPTTDLRFRFEGSRPPRINEAWARAIIATADSPTGLRIMPERDVTHEQIAHTHVTQAQVTNTQVTNAQVTHAQVTENVPLHSV